MQFNDEFMNMFNLKIDIAFIQTHLKIGRNIHMNLYYYLIMYGLNVLDPFIY